MKSRAAAVALALAVSALAFVATGDSAKATHQHPLHILMDGLHPSPGNSDTYSTCTTHLPTHLLWAWGPESWEDATSEAMNFIYIAGSPSAPCNYYVQEQFQFEGYLFCDAGVPSCHKVLIGDGYTHSTPPMGSHLHLLYGKIIFDPGWWQFILSDAWKRMASAHETGHGVGLADHFVGQCDANTIMGGYDPEEGPCEEAPTFWDAIAAMDYHGYFG